MRDKRCLVTGQAAAKRARGGNFTGLEVAHIFPLMGLGMVRTPYGPTSQNLFISESMQPEWTSTLSPSVKLLVATPQAADRPFNGMLLRADIHSLFDDYQ